MKKKEKITAEFERVIMKILETKAIQTKDYSKQDGHLTLLEKDYNEFTKLWSMEMV